jgi:hypothetical protein
MLRWWRSGRSWLWSWKSSGPESYFWGVPLLWSEQTATAVEDAEDYNFSGLDLKEDRDPPFEACGSESRTHVVTLSATVGGKRKRSAFGHYALNVHRRVPLRKAKCQIQFNVVEVRLGIGRKD